ncbi:hypothetical protein [Pseudomonas sp. G(2018)]|uniref:hypothetical protein n=1 Tax=Pseudomonas sp. G(2018) TaxID=2502242 RepID=UPI0010FA6100|nr:hypothetical protein [Pseudomonas sp. G(2018)]
MTIGYIGRARNFVSRIHQELIRQFRFFVPDSGVTRVPAEMEIADVLPASHKDALRLLSDGLCRIREAAVEAPDHAMQVADALHNLPGCIAGEDSAGEAYLTELLEKGRALLDDQSWRRELRTR